MTTIKRKIICFGESLLRFQMLNDSFFDAENRIKLYPGGSEANVAVRLANLGFSTGFVSAGPDTKLTEDYLSVLKDNKVDVSQFIYSGTRLGSYYLLSPDGLSKGEVIYDREYSSFSQLKKGDVDWDSIFNEVEWLHWTALTPALSNDSVELMEEGLKEASQRKIPISVDLNYRSKLWQYGKDPIEVMPKLIKYCDLVLGNIWASNLMLGTKIKEGIDRKTSYSEVLEFASEASQELFQKFSKIKMVAHTFRFMKNPKHNLLYGTAHTRENNVISKIEETEEIVDRIGSGDAFMAGVIAGYLQNKSLQEIVDIGIREGFEKLFVAGDF